MIALEVDVPGAKIAAWHRPGSSEQWMVLVHGAGVDHREFAPFLTDIDPAWNVVLLDLRGHGASRRDTGAPATIDTAIDDLHAVVRRFDIASCVLVGHSFGGNVAQEYVHRHPGAVRALVMIGSPGQHREMRRGEARMMRVAGSVYRRVPWRTFSRFSGRWSSRVPATRAYVTECLVATGRDTYIELGLSGYAGVHRAPASTLPTLLVRGELDMPRALDAIFDALRSVNPATSVAIIPGVGHQVMQDAPAALHAALDDFLAAHPD